MILPNQPPPTRLLPNATRLPLSFEPLPPASKNHWIIQQLLLLNTHLIKQLQTQLSECQAIRATTATHPNRAFIVEKSLWWIELEKLTDAAIPGALQKNEKQIAYCNEDPDTRIERIVRANEELRTRHMQNETMIGMLGWGFDPASPIEAHNLYRTSAPPPTALDQKHREITTHLHHNASLTRHLQDFLVSSIRLLLRSQDRPFPPPGPSSTSLAQSPPEDADEVLKKAIQLALFETNEQMLQGIRSKAVVRLSFQEAEARIAQIVGVNVRLERLVWEVEAARSEAEAVRKRARVELFHERGGTS